MAELARRNIFIVEDEDMISMLLEEILDELGYGVVDAAATLSDALKKAAVTTADAAILDVNLDGENSQPVAAALAARGIPYILSTGYGQGASDKRSTVAVLCKPFTPDDLGQTLATLLR